MAFVRCMGQKFVHTNLQLCLLLYVRVCTQFAKTNETTNNMEEKENWKQNKETSKIYDYDTNSVRTANIYWIIFYKSRNGFLPPVQYSTVPISMNCDFAFLKFYCVFPRILQVLRAFSFYKLFIAVNTVHVLWISYKCKLTERERESVRVKLKYGITFVMLVGSILHKVFTSTD